MTGPAISPVLRTSYLGSAEIADVLALAQAAGDVDGVYPLSEHVVLHIRHGGEAPAAHLLVRDPDGSLAGYAHVDTTDAVEGASAELVVHPLRRRHGIGRALVTSVIAVVDQADSGPAGSGTADPGSGTATPGSGTAGSGTAGSGGRLRLWAHGDHPAASALAVTLGFERTRVLWQMRRSLYAPVPSPRMPEGVGIRPFRPGQDDEAWVAVNARAFAGHPDQGRWTLRDLRVRMAEPWFDPSGFLLAVREQEQRHSLLTVREQEQRHSPLGASGSDGELLGFHWTKVHGEVRKHPHPDGTAPHAHDPIGEVYVLGVDPSAHGLGLGTALTLAGLRHLRGRGLDQAMLYVDESNTRAIALYTKMGFARWTTDVSFRRRVPLAPARHPDHTV